MKVASVNRLMKTGKSSAKMLVKNRKALGENETNSPLVMSRDLNYRYTVRYLIRITIP